MPTRSSTSKVVRYALIAVIIIALIGLLGWYMFLRSESDALRTLDEGRGAGIAPPSFGGILGSTYGNIVESISNFAGGTEESAVRPPRLWQVTQTPVAGAGYVPLNFGRVGAPTTSAPYIVRFVERGTGYLFEANPADGVVARLTNTLVPRVYEALVGENGVVVMRGLDESTNFIVTSVGQATNTLGSSKEPGPLTITTLPEDIRELALSRSGEEILYLIEQSPSFSVIRSQWNGKEAKRVVQLGVSGWDIDWISDDRIVLTQHAADGAVSYSYELKNSALVPLETGASVLPRPNSPAVLIASASGSTQLRARLDDTTSIASFPIRTTIDKCVWDPGTEPILYCAVPRVLPGGGSLNARYRGEAHSSDAWWKLDVNAGRTELLFEPGGTRVIDVEAPIIDRNGEYIAFTNARDKSLWILRISE